MLMSTDFGSAWKKNELCADKIVFIGKDMPKDLLTEGLRQCLAGGASHSARLSSVAFLFALSSTFSVSSPDSFS